MALIDLKRSQNAFQVIPELSLFEVGDRKFFGFFGLDQFALALNTCGHMYLGPRHICFGRRHMCLGPRHMCPGQDEIIETEKSETFSVFDVKK